VHRPPPFPSQANRILTSSYQPLPTSPSPSPPPTLPQLTSVAGDESEQEETPKEDRPQPGPYVPTALFGPPEPGPRPRAGRSSPTYRASSSSGSSEQAESRNMPYPKSHPGQRGGKLYSAGRRRSGSQISMYGIDGEVTHTHLTGAAGLRQGWQRRKGEPSR
jgi:hypothetical protein